MGKGWSKGGRSQAKPTLCPCKRYEGWEKGGRKVGEARQSPRFAHATGMKDGESVVKRWGSSEKAHALPIQRIQRMEHTTNPVYYPISTTLKPLKRNVSQKNLAIHLFV